MAKTDGPIYSAFINKKDEKGNPVYDAAARNCVRETVEALLTKTTTPDNPGMLLEKSRAEKHAHFSG